MSPPPLSCTTTSAAATLHLHIETSLCRRSHRKHCTQWPRLRSQCILDKVNMPMCSNTCDQELGKHNLVLSLLWAGIQGCVCPNLRSCLLPFRRNLGQRMQPGVSTHCLCLLPPTLGEASECFGAWWSFPAPTLNHPCTNQTQLMQERCTGGFCWCRTRSAGMHVLNSTCATVLKQRKRLAPAVGGEGWIALPNFYWSGSVLPWTRNVHFSPPLSQLHGWSPNVKLIFDTSLHFYLAFCRNVPRCSTYEQLASIGLCYVKTPSKHPRDRHKHLKSLWTNVEMQLF